MSRTGILTAIIACLSLLGGCYWLVTPPKPMVWVSQFKLKVEVATPNGVKTGEGFFQLTTKTQTFPPYVLFLLGGEPGYSRPLTQFSGEAVVIADATSTDQTLFVIMLLQDHVRTVQDMAFWSFGQQMELVHSTRNGATAEVPPELFPALVGFEDLRDPRTALEASSTKFERRFGSGYRIRKVVLKKTSQPPVQLIETKFPELIAALRTTTNKRLVLPDEAYGPHLSDFLVMRE